MAFQLPGQWFFFLRQDFLHLTEVAFVNPLENVIKKSLNFSTLTCLVMSMYILYVYIVCAET